MQTYRLKQPLSVEAVRYTGSKKSFDAIWDWTGGSGGHCGGYGGDEDDPREFRLKTALGRATVDVGDWVIKKADGSFTACGNAEFLADYEPCD